MSKLNKAPLVGLTTYPVDDAGRYGIPAQYVDSVRRAGGVPLLIPAGGTDVDEMLERLDAVVLIGGGDIDPARYGGETHETIYNLSAERDGMELAMVNGLLERRVPTLAICRGLQVITVALGGTLFEHLPEHFGETVAHRIPPRDPVTHDYEADADSKLADIIGATRFEAKSWHHQAVRDVAPGFKIVARAPDGCPEAIEDPDRPELVCVQWHPELTAADDAAQQRLFDYVVGLGAQASS